ncbi:MAG: hypothetical protein HFI12_07945 [Lachnospiraceae bacterium]|jgi:corrinoid protein of di/trimethylamine methyltransferase|nr:hypothetical protein [Lachnospiraceae bacterium]
MSMEKVNDLVTRGKAKLVPAAVQEALDEGCEAGALLDTMIAAMDVVGENFKNGTIFVPEMLIAAKAMKKGVEVLKPHLASGASGALGKVIIGTVAGDLHDIGKNLVAMMIESAGFEVIDLGVDVPIENFLRTYEENPDTKIIACSALLTTTMPALQQTVAAINEASWRSKVKVMVGGAPITQEFADTIGADAYTPDAVFHHDDWGSQISTFISPEMFREFIKPAYEKIYGYFKSHGVEIIVHHSDSYAATLVPDMIDMGIDVWQGVMNTNNIPELIEKYGGKITFMGGIDSVSVDRPDWTPKLVAAEVQKTCKNCGNKYFIPNLSQGLAVSTFPGVYEAVSAEIDKMSKEMF